MVMNGATASSEPSMIAQHLRRCTHAHARTEARITREHTSAHALQERMKGVVVKAQFSCRRGQIVSVFERWRGHVRQEGAENDGLAGLLSRRAGRKGLELGYKPGAPDGGKEAGRAGKGLKAGAQRGHEHAHVDDLRAMGGGGS